MSTSVVPNRFKIEDIVHPHARAHAQQYECPVCMCLLDEPVQTNCEHLFCKNCLSECLACPTCRAPFSDGKKGELLSDCNRVVLRMMQSIKVFCPYHPDADTTSSENNSKVKGVSSSSGGGASSSSAPPPPSKKRKREVDQDEQQHECDWVGSYGDLLAKHLSECPYHMIECPRKCGEKLRRKDLDLHAKSCSKMFDFCPICNDAVNPGKMEEHRARNMVRHVQILENKVEDSSVADLLQKETRKNEQLQRQLDAVYKRLDICGLTKETIRNSIQWDFTDIGEERRNSKHVTTVVDTISEALHNYAIQGSKDIGTDFLAYIRARLSAKDIDKIYHNWSVIGGFNLEMRVRLARQFWLSFYFKDQKYRLCVFGWKR